MASVKQCILENLSESDKSQILSDILGVEIANQLKLEIESRIHKEDSFHLRYKLLSEIVKRYLRMRIPIIIPNPIEQEDMVGVGRTYNDFIEAYADVLLDASEISNYRLGD